MKTLRLSVFAVQEEKEKDGNQTSYHNGIHGKNEGSFL
jgi:hypothetical protein